MLALRRAAQIPPPIPQLLHEVLDVLSDRLDTRSNPVEALEPGCHFLHHGEEPFLDAWAGQLEGYLPGRRFRLIERHRLPSIFGVPIGGSVVEPD